MFHNLLRSLSAKRIGLLTFIGFFGFSVIWFSWWGLTINSYYWIVALLGAVAVWCHILLLKRVWSLWTCITYFLSLALYAGFLIIIANPHPYVGFEVLFVFFWLVFLLAAKDLAR